MLRLCRFGSRSDHQIALHLANGLTQLSSLSFGRLFVIAVPLHVTRQTFALAKSLEALQHLLDGFITARSNSYHCNSLPTAIRHGPTHFTTCSSAATTLRPAVEGSTAVYGIPSSDASGDFSKAAGARISSCTHIRGNPFPWTAGDHGTQDGNPAASGDEIGISSQPRWGVNPIAISVLLGNILPL